MGPGAAAPGLRVLSSHGLGFRGFRVQSSGFRFWGFRVQGLGFKVSETFLGLRVLYGLGFSGSQVFWGQGLGFQGFVLLGFRIIYALGFSGFTLSLV